MEKLIFRISWILLAVAILIIPAVGEQAVRNGPWGAVIAVTAIAAIALRLCVLQKTKIKKRKKPLV
nr:hypothetical protein [uncultured Anaerostipes sp.]